MFNDDRLSYLGAFHFFFFILRGFFGFQTAILSAVPFSSGPHVFEPLPNLRFSVCHLTKVALAVITTNRFNLNTFEHLIHYF